MCFSMYHSSSQIPRLRTSAASTAENVNMRAARLIKYPGNQHIFRIEHNSADRTRTGSVSFKTIWTAADMHQSVGIAHRRKGRGFYPFASFQSCRTHRTSSWSAGNAFFNMFFSFSLPSAKRNTSCKIRKKRISKPEKQHSHHNKDETLNIRTHTLIIGR